MTITSPHNEHLKGIRKLNQRRRAREQTGRFVAEGEDLLAAADLDSTYLGYLDAVPAEALAVVNLMSLFGLHRWLRGAAIGHFASTEITSPPGSRRSPGAGRAAADRQRRDPLQDAL